MPPNRQDRPVSRSVGYFARCARFFFAFGLNGAGGVFSIARNSKSVRRFASFSGCRSSESISAFAVFVSSAFRWFMSGSLRRG